MKTAVWGCDGSVKGQMIGVVVYNANCMILTIGRQCRTGAQGWQHIDGTVRTAASGWQCQDGTVRTALSGWHHQNGSISLIQQY